MCMYHKSIHYRHTYCGPGVLDSVQKACLQRFILQGSGWMSSEVPVLHLRCCVVDPAETAKLLLASLEFMPAKTLAKSAVQGTRSGKRFKNTCEFNIKTIQPRPLRKPSGHRLQSTLRSECHRFVTLKRCLTEAEPLPSPAGSAEQLFRRRNGPAPGAGQQEEPRPQQQRPAASL